LFCIYSELTNLAPSCLKINCEHKIYCQHYNIRSDKTFNTICDEAKMARTKIDESLKEKCVKLGQRYELQTQIYFIFTTFSELMTSYQKEIGRWG